jgi:peptidoglycan L-alanyl-D-glutamate endopeptidase CwlK
MLEMVQAQHAYCEDYGFFVYVTETLRPLERQAILYRQGHTLAEIKAKMRELTAVYGCPYLADVLWKVGPQYGEHSTDAGPGQSFHQYGDAEDGYPWFQDENGLWTLCHDRSNNQRIEMWDQYVEASLKAGLESLYTIGDYPHVHNPAKHWKEQIVRYRNYEVPSQIICTDE